MTLFLFLFLLRSFSNLAIKATILLAIRELYLAQTLWVNSALNFEFLKADGSQRHPDISLQ